MNARSRQQSVKGKRDDLPWSTDSTMESNVARVLCYLEDIGAIKDLERCDIHNKDHEIDFPDTKHGTTRTFLDFRFKLAIDPSVPSVPFMWPSAFIMPPNVGDDEWVWVEVKGFLDSKSKTRFRNMYKQRRDIWDNTMFVVKYDKRFGNLFDHQIPKKRNTAHAFLRGIGATHSQIWFIEDLGDLCRLQMQGTKYEWEGR